MSIIVGVIRISISLITTNGGHRRQEQYLVKEARPDYSCMGLIGIYLFSSFVSTRMVDPSLRV